MRGSAARPGFGREKSPVRAMIVLSMFLLSACAPSGPKFGAPGSVARIVDQKDLPPPTLADTQGSRPYLVAPFDKLSVEVFGLPELSRDTVQVGADGVLSYPLAGNVAVGGKSANEVEDLLETALRGRYLRNPQVTVNLKETLTQRVAVEGQVNQPGMYPVIGRTTLLRTMALARGTTENADAQEVIIMREVNGQQMAALHNLRAIRRGVYADPEIYPNDIVIVGDSSQRRMMRELLGAISTLSYPIIATIQTLQN